MAYSGSSLAPWGPSGLDLGFQLGHLGSVLPLSWAMLGSVWAHLGLSEASLDPSWIHLSSKMAPKSPSDPLQAPFWPDFGTILGLFSLVFLAYVWCFLHAFFSSMLQTKTFKITRKHQKNASESSQETVSLFVPSCIEKFTSERKVAFRSLLVQVETG